MKKLLSFLVLCILVAQAHAFEFSDYSNVGVQELSTMMYEGKEYDMSPVMWGFGDNVYTWKGYTIRTIGWNNNADSGKANMGFFVVISPSGEDLCISSTETATWGSYSVCRLMPPSVLVLDNGKLIIRAFDIHPDTRGKYYRFQVGVLKEKPETQLSQQIQQPQPQQHQAGSGKLLLLGFGLISLITIVFLLSRRR